MTSTDNIAKMMKGFSLISGKFASILGALALAFTGLIYIRLVKGVLQERCNEIGIMKALGWRRRDVTSALFTESLALGAGGAALGLAVGWLAAWGVGELGVGASLPWNLNPLPAGVGPRSAAAGGPTVSLPMAFSWLAGGASLIFALTLSALMGWWVGSRMFKATVLTSLSEP
jgi:putative ABC transport system permease protein